MKKDNLMIHNAMTDEIIIRELTDEEQAERDAQVAAAFIELKAKQDAEEVAWKTKVSAYEKLGLNEAEIAAIAPAPEHLRPIN